MTFSDFCRLRRPPDTPDPAQYEIRSTFGSGPKYSIQSRYKDRARAVTPEYTALPSTLSKKGCTIGPKIEMKREADNIPGPFYYTTTIGQGRKSAIQERRQEPVNDNPGPGQYDVPTGFTGHGCSIGVGRRTSLAPKGNPHVGPGSYTLPSEMSQRRPITVSERAREPFKRRGHPGPCYDVSGQIGRDARKCAFPKGPRETNIERTPGPGDYDVPVEVGGKTRLAPTLRGRPKQRDNDIDNRPLYNPGDTITPKKKSIGSRPVTSYETDSPGPGYNIGTTIVPRKKSIGVWTAIKNPHDDVPSPGSYWMMEEAPRPPPITSFPGPEDRCIVNLREEAKKPGPGYYEQADLLGLGKRGFKFPKSRNTDVKPDTAAPYHPCKSTLGGPMFTIGLRDV